SAVVHGQLAQDGRDVVLHRLVADAEAARDLLVAVAAGDVLQHFYFTRRQRDEDWLRFWPDAGELAELAQHARGQQRPGEDAVVDEVVAGMGAAHRGHEVDGLGVDREVGRSAYLNGVEQLLLILEGGQQEHRDRRR